MTEVFCIDIPDDSVRILPMTDHYAVLSRGEIVAVVTRINEFQWQVRTLKGRTPEPNSCIPLDMALQAAAKWSKA